MSDDTAPTEVKAGDVITILTTGISVPSGDIWIGGQIMTRGDVFRVSQEQIAASHDRYGTPGGIMLAGDPAEQLRRWGVQRFHLGKLDLDPWQRGDETWVEQREIARRAAHAEPDPERRAAALAAVHEKFGPGPSTSTHVPIKPDGYWQRRAEEVEERHVREGRVHRNKSSYSNEDAHLFPKKDSV
jgi:hypothetical protein